MDRHLAGEQALAYTLGAVDTAERAAIEAHAATCPRCTAELAELQSEHAQLTGQLRAYAGRARPSRASDWSAVAPRIVGRRTRNGGAMLRLAVGGLAAVVLFFAVAGGVTVAVGGVQSLPAVGDMVGDAWVRIHRALDEMRPPAPATPDPTPTVPPAQSPAPTVSATPSMPPATATGQAAIGGAGPEQDDADDAAREEPGAALPTSLLPTPISTAAGDSMPLGMPTATTGPGEQRPVAGTPGPGGGPRGPGAGTPGPGGGHRGPGGGRRGPGAGTPGPGGEPRGPGAGTPGPGGGPRGPGPGTPGPGGGPRGPGPGEPDPGHPGERPTREPEPEGTPGGARGGDPGRGGRGGDPDPDATRRPGHPGPGPGEPGTREPEPRHPRPGEPGLPDPGRRGQGRDRPSPEPTSAATPAAPLGGPPPPASSGAGSAG